MLDTLVEPTSMHATSQPLERDFDTMYAAFDAGDAGLHYHDIRNRRPALTPERWMMVSLFEQALTDLAGPHPSLVLDAAAWFTYQPKLSDGYPFHFRSVCRELGLEPNAVSRTLLTRHAAHLAWAQAAFKRLPVMRERPDKTRSPDCGSVLKHCRCGSRAPKPLVERRSPAVPDNRCPECRLLLKQCVCAEAAKTARCR